GGVPLRPAGTGPAADPRAGGQTGRRQAGDRPAAAATAVPGDRRGRSGQLRGGAAHAEGGAGGLRVSASRASARSTSRTRTPAARERTRREPAARKPPASPDLRILETQIFRGPNYWSYEPCIRLLV